ncbi:hypothetical protein ACQV88_25765, partial [Ralstonia pseudosolanacearum]
MQTFKDIETGRFFQLDDDVRVVETPTGRIFYSAHGELLNAPATLVPASFDDQPEPPEVVPASVSRYQGRQALRLSTIEAGFIVINDTFDNSPAKRDLLEVVEELLARPETPAYYRDAWA